MFGECVTSEQSHVTDSHFEIGRVSCVTAMVLCARWLFSKNKILNSKQASPLEWTVRAIALTHNFLSSIHSCVSISSGPRIYEWCMPACVLTVPCTSGESLVNEEEREKTFRIQSYAVPVDSISAFCVFRTLNIDINAWQVVVVRWSTCTCVQHHRVSRKSSISISIACQKQFHPSKLLGSANCRIAMAVATATACKNNRIRCTLSHSVQFKSHNFKKMSKPSRRLLFVVLRSPFFANQSVWWP